MRALAILHAAVFVFGFLVGVTCMTAASDSGKEGKDAFTKRCGGCHGVDSAKEGPALRGVVGRRAGTQPSFPYSSALKAANFVWDEPILDRWLADPDTVVPGADMAFRLPNPDERGRIIEYIKQLK